MRLVPVLVTGLVSCAPETPPPTPVPDPAPAPDAPDRPSFLVIDIDTLAAGRVGATRDGRPVTPHLDRLAERAVTFDQAWTNGGWTLPALTALMTGRYPDRVQATSDGLSWQRSASRTLPDILKAYGYQTAAIWGQGMGPLLAGITPGFDTNQILFQPAFAPGKLHPPGTPPPRRWIPPPWRVGRPGSGSPSTPGSPSSSSSTRST